MDIEMEDSVFGESLEQEVRGVLLNWLGVSPLETEDTGGVFQ